MYDSYSGLTVVLPRPPTEATVTPSTSNLVIQTTTTGTGSSSTAQVKKTNVKKGKLMLASSTLLTPWCASSLLFFYFFSHSLLTVAISLPSIISKQTLTWLPLSSKRFMIISIRTLKRYDDFEITIFLIHFTDICLKKYEDMIKERKAAGKDANWTKIGMY